MCERPKTKLDLIRDAACAQVRENQAKRAKLCPVLAPWYEETNRHSDRLWELTMDESKPLGERQVLIGEAMRFYAGRLQEAILLADELGVAIPFQYVNLQSADPTKTATGETIQ